MVTRPGEPGYERFVQELDVKRQEQRTEAVKQKDAITALTATEGWAIVARFIRAQVEARQARFFLEEGGASEYKRGEIGGLLLIEKYPEIVKLAAEEVLTSLAQEREQIHGTKKRRDERADPEADDTSGWTEADG